MKVQIRYWPCGRNKFALINSSHNENTSDITTKNNALFFWYLKRQRFYRTLRKPSKMPTEIHGVSLLRGARLDGFARFLRAPCFWIHWRFSGGEGDLQISGCRLSLSCTLTLTCIYGDDPVHTDKSQTFLEWDLMTRHVSHFTPPVILIKGQWPYRPASRWGNAKFSYNVLQLLLLRYLH